MWVEATGYLKLTNGVPEKWCPGNIYLRGRSASGVQAPNVSLINRHTVIIG